MRITLDDLLATQRVLLADGATGTNYFAAGLGPGDPPENWNLVAPDLVRELHQRFVDVGADIILTNSFGGTRHRLKLHQLDGRVHELAKCAAELAGEVAAAAPRPVLVAGSVGPTGELFEPMGALTHDVAVASFCEQIEGLREGGADVVWIETMSSTDEVRAAAQAAIDAGMPYVATCSFDTAGRTMMGLMPHLLVDVFDGLNVPPVGYGANCGVGAPDILVSIGAMTERSPDDVIVCKGNCGIPKFHGSEIFYSGTPELMANYARLAVDSGARIVGGCCGTSPVHLAAMRTAIDAHTRGVGPDIATIIEQVGPLTNTVPTANAPTRERRRGRREP